MMREFSTAKLKHDRTEKILPKSIVAQLDKYIVGQEDAKKAVANAIHNRWRREQLSPELQKEISPKNILMVGPSGVGKTEIARRLAKLVKAPFIKVEATKYTETGFHGADVDTIIKDLVKVAIAQRKKYLKEQSLEEINSSVEDRILAMLVGELPERWMVKFRSMLREGAMDEFEVSIPTAEIEEEPQTPGNIRIILDPQKMQGQQEEIKWEYKTVKEAKKLLADQQVDQLSEQQDEELVKEAIKDVEERGIVFIDEIDKICVTKDQARNRGDASDEGVQRDLLPLIEGTVIDTKFGEVNTNKILFITSGAFYSAKPRDILPELQGRLPIRVNLNPLTEDDMYRILVEPEYNLVKQQIALMKTEEIDVQFPDQSIREIAKLASEINRSVENIGARRLHSLIEKIMEETSFSCKKGIQMEVTIPHIHECAKPMMEKADTSKYII